MSIASVIAAASALRDVNERVEALQAEKDEHQARIAQINAELATMRAERDQKVATLKTEANTI